MFAEFSVLIKLAFRGSVALFLDLALCLILIVRSSFSNKSYNSLNNVCKNSDSANINTRRTVVGPPLVVWLTQILTK